MNSDNSSKKAKWVLFAALLLIICGGFLAYFIQTGGNTIKIRDIRFIGTNGKLNSALLYVPPGVSNDNPAPGIVATHGYLNSRETQSVFAIEFARRGYVVLVPDQPGHGFSDPPAFGNGYGGMDTLKYLRALDIVDADNIGLEGHFMGGWASVAAAAANPYGYKSLVLAGSSTGNFGIPDGTSAFPRNMAIIFGAYDEFSEMMWGSPIPKNIVNSEKLKRIFNTTETVQVGKLYGSIEEGTARKLYQPPIINSRAHFSTQSIGSAIEWMQMTLQGGKNIPAANQVWYWKELGTFMAMIGMLLLLFPLGQLLLQTNFFKELSESAPEIKSQKGFGWWVGAILTVIIPLPLFMWAIIPQLKEIQFPGTLWPQNITTAVMRWVLAISVVLLILFLLWHLIFNRKKASFVNYGVTWKDKGMDWKKIGKSFLLAAIICATGYLTLAFSGWAFMTDYRLWVFAVKPMTLLHLRIFFSYLLPFIVFFLVIGLILHGQLRRGKTEGELKIWTEMLLNIFLLITGLLIIQALQYGPLFAGGKSVLPPLSLFLPLSQYFVVMFQFFPLFAIAALISTYFYRKTGHIYTGAFLNAMLVTWIIVAGQAIHYAF